MVSWCRIFTVDGFEINWTKLFIKYDKVFSFAFVESYIEKRFLNVSFLCYSTVKKLIRYEYRVSFSNGSDKTCWVVYKKVTLILHFSQFWSWIFKFWNSGAPLANSNVLNKWSASDHFFFILRTVFSSSFLRTQSDKSLTKAELYTKCWLKNS